MNYHEQVQRQMQQTSLEAFYSINSDKLGTKQLQVYLALKKIQPATNAMIADYLDWPINTITPRVNELRSKEPQPLILTSHKAPCKITGKTALYWKVSQ